MASTAAASESSSTRILVSKIYEYLPYLVPLLLIVHLIRRRYGSPLRKYPGPVLASFSRLHSLLSVASGKYPDRITALHARYGPIVRIAPNELSFSSPEAARELLSAGKGFHKTPFYSVFPPPENPDIFTETREDVHARKKRVANVPYSMAAMQQLTPFIDETIEVLLSKLNNSEGKVDLGDWLHFFAFDVLGEVAFSRKFGFLVQGVDIDDTIKTIDDSQWYNGIVGQVPELNHLFRNNPLWKLVPAIKMGKSALITQMALNEMGKRKPFEKSGGRTDMEADRKDLLQSLIEGHLKSPDKFGEGDVFAVAHGAISFAGSDSTASTMQSFFWHVLRDPRVYSAVVSEVLTASKSGKLSERVTWAEAQQLPYFQACLKEAMRTRPAVGVNISRLIPQGGAEVNGTWLPGGTSVAVNGWVLHKDKRIFGEDADDFKPERWLEDEEKAKKMERYMFQFGGGSHLCIGRNLALLEMNKILPLLLKEYDIELIHPDRPLNANTTFFVVQSGLEVLIKRRGS
ncbi:Cytochrome P450 monooxygenase [Hyphodiscus hymeniophilus]|uniref:Cytochrome P450 monooxygenase n=1 Tax=Hyphodiscus hymeniophilus TaxID=353542 RepID=A0A9P6VH50_9HELO|nr:Cytochrome P450 monooxygenase [Hyphodiscus hymeniophilus]